MILAAIISLIAALTNQRGVIGREGVLPWSLPADLSYFRSITMGKAVVMGHNTWKAIGRTPLSGRRNIVLSRDSSLKLAGAEVFNDPAAVLDYCSNNEIDSEVFVIGGAEIYRLFMPRAARLYLTAIDSNIDGDCFFPEIDLDCWKEVYRREGVFNQENPHPHTFLILERKC